MSLLTEEHTKFQNLHLYVQFANSRNASPHFVSCHEIIDTTTI